MHISWCLGWIGRSKLPNKGYPRRIYLYIEWNLWCLLQSNRLLMYDARRLRAKIFMASADAPLWRTLVRKPRWWYQKKHPNIIGGTIVDDMTPLSCLYYKRLRRYGRKEVDVMVAMSIFCSRVDGFGLAGRRFRYCSVPVQFCKSILV